MAALFGDSFDFHTDATILRRWGAGNALVGTAYGRWGTQGAYVNEFTYLLSPTLAPADNTFIFGMAVRFNTGGNAQDAYGNGFLRLYRQGVTQMEFSPVLVGGALRVYRGNRTTLLDTTSAGISGGPHDFLEVKIVAATGTGGSVVVRINHNVVLNLTGINTAPSGVNGWDSFSIGSWSARQIFLDDVYACDGSGARNNDFLGDGRMRWIPIIAGNGNSNQWSRSAGADTGALLDEALPNDDTDYIYSATVGQKTTAPLQSTAGLAGTAKFVQSVFIARKDDAGARVITPVMRIGSTDYEGANVSLSGSYIAATKIHETSPATGTDWTIAGLPTEMGPKLA